MAAGWSLDAFSLWFLLSQKLSWIFSGHEGDIIIILRCFCFDSLFPFGTSHSYMLISFAFIQCLPAPFFFGFSLNRFFCSLSSGNLLEKRSLLIRWMNIKTIQTWIMFWPTFFCTKYLHRCNLNDRNRTCDDDGIPYYYL
jgi:hypothetical protein